MKHEPAPMLRGAVASVLVVDDHPLYRDALASSLELIFPGCAVRTAKSLTEALSLVERGLQPDLVMFDLKLPDVAGISGFQALRARMPDVPILVISALGNTEVVHALMDEGAAGFLPKEAAVSELRAAVVEVANGGRHLPEQYRRSDEMETPCAAHPILSELTPQQAKIMRLICAGKANKQIAYELSLAEATVKAHISALLKRLGVQNRTQAAVMIETVSNAGADDADGADARRFLSR